MNKEEIKELARQSMKETIENNLHSEMIFMYVDNLEKKEEKERQALLDIKEELGSKKALDSSLAYAVVKTKLLDIVNKAIGEDKDLIEKETILHIL